MRADLHIHTSKSDGTDSVEEIIDKAINIGLDAVAITDHDNVSALEDGERYAKGKLTFIRGIEFSAYSNQEVHILGYGFDYKADIITETVDTLIKKRKARAEKIIEKLNAKNIRVDFGELKSGCIGRPHISLLIKEKGYVKSINEAFDLYLGSKGSCYVPSGRMTPLEAVKIIREARGIPVLAHPSKFLDTGILPSLIEGLKRYGLMGLECYYPSHDTDTERRLCFLARKNALIITQGSDYHGKNAASALGQMSRDISESVISKLARGEARFKTKSDL